MIYIQKGGTKLMASSIFKIGTFGLLVIVVIQMVMIMKFMNVAKQPRSYKTSGPLNTKEIIDSII